MSTTFTEKEYRRRLRSMGYHCYQEESGKLVTNIYPHELEEFSKKVGMKVAVVPSNDFHLVLVRVAVIEP